MAIEIQRSHLWDGCKTDTNPHSRFYKTVLTCDTYENALLDLVKFINSNGIDQDHYYRIKTGNVIVNISK